MIETRLKFPCGELSLEGVTSVPEGPGPFPAVVVCHPHPQHGGDMDNDVVTAVCQALGQASIASLRFNFRGVKASGGTHDVGVGEQDDLIAALDFVSSLEGIDKDRVGVCGYSFGGAVALHVAPADKRVKALALISPAVESYVRLTKYDTPKLIVCGSADQFVSIIALQRLAEELSPPVQCEFISGADHFWGGFEDKVAAKVAAFLADRLKPSPG